jgi:hypothetical protein
LCTFCGGENLPCCADGSCREWHVCTAEETCATCGDIDEDGCPGGECKGWFTFFNGQCVNTFAVDPNAQSSLCETAEEGSGSKSRRDWCYWYAAYEKGDTALCAPIAWGEMREKCEAGADPDHFYVISFPGAP